MLWLTMQASTNQPQAGVTETMYVAAPMRMRWLGSLAVAASAMGSLGLNRHVLDHTTGPLLRVLSSVQATAKQQLGAKSLGLIAPAKC